MIPYPVVTWKQALAFWLFKLGGAEFVVTGEWIEDSMRATSIAQANAFALGYASRGCRITSIEVVIP